MALIVVVHHTLTSLPAFITPSGSWLVEAMKLWPLRLLWGGEEAVIVFFVLSGFALTQGFLGGDTPSWANFVRRRLLRLYPGYLVALLASAACAAALSTYQLDGMTVPFNAAWRAPMSGQDVLLSALFLLDARQINPALWSLVVEMHVSLVFPLLFMATVRLGPWASLVLAAALSKCALELADLVPAWFSGIGAIPLVAFLLVLKSVYLLIVFVLGILLATYRPVIITRLAHLLENRFTTLAVVGLGLLGLDGRLPYGMSAWAVGLGAVALLTVVLASERVQRLLAAKSLQWLGRISYSLYLIHMTVLYSLFYELHAHLPPYAIALLVTPASLLAGWLLWVVVERPSLGWSRRVREPQAPRQTGQDNIT